MSQPIPFSLVAVTNISCVVSNGLQSASECQTSIYCKLSYLLDALGGLFILKTSHNWMILNYMILMARVSLALPYKDETIYWRLSLKYVYVWAHYMCSVCTQRWESLYSTNIRDFDWYYQIQLYKYQHTTLPSLRAGLGRKLVGRLLSMLFRKN